MYYYNSRKMYTDCEIQPDFAVLFLRKVYNIGVQLKCNRPLTFFKPQLVAVTGRKSYNKTTKTQSGCDAGYAGMQIH